MGNQEFSNAADEDRNTESLAEERRKKLHEHVEATRPVLEFRANNRTNHIKKLIERVTTDSSSVDELPD